MCKELYHLMNLEELLDTLHPDAKRAVCGYMGALEVDNLTLSNECEELSSNLNWVEEDLSDLHTKVQEQEKLITELYKEIEELEQEIDN